MPVVGSDSFCQLNCFFCEGTDVWDSLIPGMDTFAVSVTFRPSKKNKLPYSADSNACPHNHGDITVLSVGILDYFILSESC